MANASKTSIGPGAQGKQSGTGAMTDLPEGILPENIVLSNRDKSQHTDQRGLDSKHVQTEQYQDHAGNRLDAGGAEGSEEGEGTEARAAGGRAGNTSGLANPMTDLSGDESSLKRRQHG
ncbi:hypothetical protein [Methylobacterium radiodurans]|uniref:Uncharacterized protein n=1 Tax=Methylobacterium radiodurans TaxID=2202828 RepID=A0A2U8VZJ8_9HYPH|nr:hypothetical protein [Methylobacterium radiodurans]AWN39243.1 hypothetical protein DK427_25895 [Methylobacterium radiodurans]